MIHDGEIHFDCYGPIMEAEMGIGDLVLPVKMCTYCMGLSEPNMFTFVGIVATWR